jgi:predicted HTH transcriptional regulator
MPIPSSNSPAYDSLRSSIDHALQELRELPSIEFKRSEEWEVLKFHITRSSMAMTNLRDGGMIIIGVSDVDGVWQLTGVLSEHLVTYDVDAMLIFINSYASPALQPVVVSHTYQENTYLVIELPQFDRIPIVCQGQHDVGKLLKGRVYIRPAGFAESRPIDHELEMHDLLEIASNNQARYLIARAQGVGMIIPEVANEFAKKLDDEVKDL